MMLGGGVVKRCRRSIGDLALDIGDRTGVARRHVSLLVAGRGHIFIHAFVAAHEFGEADIFQVGVAHGGADVWNADYLFNG